MRTNFLVALAIFFMTGYTNPEPALRSPQEQESVKKEITAVIDGIVQSLEKRDAEALFQSYQDSPEFILLTTDGSMMDYAAAKAHHVKWFSSLSSLKVTTTKDEFRFLPGNTVIYAWRSKFEMTLKTGGAPTMDFGITLVFHKIDDHWKVVYQQTSALPPGQEKSNR